MLSVNTNSTALIAQNNLGNTQKAMENSMLKLSTGLRINSAADDAAGMQISNRMGTQISGLDVAMRNANDAISMAQTAEGAMSETSNIMGRMRDLALQSANDTNTQDDRDSMQAEVNSLKDEINRIAEKTNFSGINLLDGNADMSFQIGSNANDTIDFSIAAMSASSLKGEYTDITDGTVTGTVVTSTLNTLNGSGTTAGADLTVAVGGVNLTIATTDKDAAGTGVGTVDAQGLADAINLAIEAEEKTAGKAKVSVGENNSLIFTGDEATTIKLGSTDANITGVTTKGSVDGIKLDSAENAQAAVRILDDALKLVDSERANLGAVQNRLDSTVSNLSNIQENMTVSQGRILDVDFAKETTSMTKSQMLMQAGSSVLAQAKGLPQYAVQLMG